jgi:ribosomal-protein-alanine N-acetyltransferase
VKGNPLIRQAQPSDRAFIAALSGKAFSVYGPYRTTVSRWFDSGVTMTFVSTAQARPVGFVMIGALPGDTEGETRAEVLAIAVLPAFQNKGIGEGLLQHAERRLEEMGEKRIFLHTAKENLAAQKLFLRSGFRPVEMKKGFYPFGQDALMMVHEIRKDRDTDPLGAKPCPRSMRFPDFGLE